MFGNEFQLRTVPSIWPDESALAPLGRNAVPKKETAAQAAGLTHIRPQSTPATHADRSDSAADSP